MSTPQGPYGPPPQQGGYGQGPYPGGYGQQAPPPGGSPYGPPRYGQQAPPPPPPPGASPYGPPGYGPQAPPQPGGYPQQAPPGNPYGQPGYGAQPPYGPPWYAPAPYGYGPPVAGDHDCVGARIGQYLLDVLVQVVAPFVVGIIVLIVGLAIAAGGGTGGATAFSALAYLIIFGGILALSFWNYVYRPTKNGGQTLGMKWTNLRIVKTNGTPLTMSDTVLRWLLLSVDGLVAGLVGVLIMSSSPIHQRLGDKVTDTIVVRA